MSYQSLHQKIVGVGLVMLFLSGCGVPAATADPVPPTEISIPPTDTATTAPPPAAATAASADGIWAARAEMPTERWELSTSVVDGKIYATGGAGPSWKALGSVEEYDPKQK